MCAGGCGGSGNKFVARTTTSQQYTPSKTARQLSNRPYAQQSANSNNNGARSFGSPKISFSGKRK